MRLQKSLFLLLMLMLAFVPLSSRAEQPFKSGTLPYYCLKGDLASVKRELAKHPKEMKNTFLDYGQPIHIAAMYGRIEIVRYLVGKGVSVETCQPDDCGKRTPLLVAASGVEDAGPNNETKCLEVIQFLLKNKAQLQVKDPKSPSPLDVACQSRRLRIAQFFYDKGLHNFSPSTFSMAVVGAKDTDATLAMLNWLLDKGAKLDSRDVNGKTALHNCSDFGLPAVTRFLLERGADINARKYTFSPDGTEIDDKEGPTPLELAEQMITITNNRKMNVAPYEEVAALLRKAAQK